MCAGTTSDDRSVDCGRTTVMQTSGRLLRVQFTRNDKISLFRCPCFLGLFAFAPSFLNMVVDFHVVVPLGLGKVVVYDSTVDTRVCANGTKIELYTCDREDGVSNFIRMLIKRAVSNRLSSGTEHLAVSFSHICSSSVNSPRRRSGPPAGLCLSRRFRCASSPHRSAKSANDVQGCLGRGCHQD